MPTSRQIEWWLGLEPGSLGFETATDLGLEQYTIKPMCRLKASYLFYSRYKQRKKEEEKRMWARYRATGDKWIRYRLHQKIQARWRAKYWRRLGNPDLRAAWAARHEQALRQRPFLPVWQQRNRLSKQLGRLMVEDSKYGQRRGHRMVA